MAWPCFLVAISLIVFKKWRWYFIGIAWLVTSLLLIADKLFFIAFSSLITTSSFKIANQAWDIKSSIFKMLTILDLIIVLFFLVFWFIGFLVNQHLDSGLEKNPKAFFIDKAFGILFFLVALSSFNTAFYLDNHQVEWVLDDNNQKKIIAHSSQAELENSRWRDKQHFRPPFQSSILDYAVSFGIFNFHIKNIYDAVSKTIIETQLPEKELERITHWLGQKKRLNAIESPFRGEAKGRNIFLIALESIHPLLIDLKVDGEEITPTLNRLKSQALFWNHFMDQSYGGGSSDSEFALMTGLLPSRHYISSVDLPGNISLIAMPSVLSTNGYHTFSFHGYKASFWNRNKNHPLYGIDNMFFMESFSTDKMLGMGIPDKQFFSQSLDILKKQPTPFFAYLISLSNHHPYKDVPEGYKKLFTNHVSAGSELSGYLQLVRYSDDALGRFIKKAKNEGFWNNSVFIFCGDHVPPFSEEAKSHFANITGGSLKNFRQLRTPLLILIPGKEEKVRKYKNQYVSIVGDQHDIFPTLFHLLGKDTPYGITGTHLFVPNNKRDPLFITQDIFIYEELIYHGPSGRRLSSNLKTLMPNDKDIKNTQPSMIRDKFLKSLNDMSNHEMIYKYDAQAKAIARYESQGLKCIEY